MKYNNVYWSKEALDLDNTGADVLAVGDSWFWYPMPGGSLITQIGDLVAPRGHNILVAGNNGAEAYDYVKGKYKRQVKELLRLYGSTASALLLSGGGNDFAGFNDMRPLLCGDCSAAATPDECFLPGDDEGTIEWLMQRVFESYAMLISRAMFILPSHAQVLVHSYDYSVPNGHGVYGGPGWLKPALDNAQVPAELQPGCIKFVIDYFESVLAQLVSSGAGRVMLVDSRGVLSPGDWANELHPKPAGFKKIAQQRWQPALAQLGLA